MPPAAPTLAQIAENCGLSTMTVSRALRGDSGIAAQTRQQVLAVARRMGYRPRVRSGRPRRGAAAKRPSVAVVYSTDAVAGTFFFSHLLASLEGELSRQNHVCRVLAATVGNQYERFLQVVENLREGGDEAVLLVGYLPHRQLQTLVHLAPTRLVLVDHTGDPRVRGDYDCVAFDNVEAARLAVRHLAENSRKRIALLSGTADHYFSRDIEHGYHDMLNLLDVPANGRMVWRGGFEPMQACDVVREQLRRGVKFDAVFTTDEMALGVYRALSEAGLRVPQDVAVVGCDGLPFGDVLMPALTTVMLDWHELGRVAAEHALGRHGRTDLARRIRLAPRLCVRESCGAQPSAT